MTLRYLTLAASVMLAAACNSGNSDAASAPSDEAAAAEAPAVLTGEVPPADLFLVCNVPFEDSPDFGETRTFIAYAGELRNFNQSTGRIEDNCNPRRDGCRDYIEDGAIVSSRTIFIDGADVERVVTIDLDSLTGSEVKTVEGVSTPVDTVITCERHDYPAQVEGPSSF